MTRAIQGAPAEPLRRALKALSELWFWIAWTADTDLAPEPHASVRCIRDAATTLRRAADLLDLAVDPAEAHDGRGVRHGPGR